MALVFLSLVEHESGDRPFALDPAQRNLIDAVTALNPNTIAVVSVGGGVEMASWIGKVKGLFYAWYPGTYGTAALAEALFGEYNPSGKLPISIEKRAEDSHYAGRYLPEGAELSYTWPGWGQNPKVHDVSYTEGVFTGYRWYDHQDIDPLFPFGFGLSYTTFAVGKPQLSAATIRENDVVTVKVEVTNTGTRAGAEVLQLYVAPPKSDVERPVRELKDFGKVTLQAGETGSVEMQLNWKDLAYWDEGRKAWTVVPGRYGIEMGTSSREIHSSSTLLAE